MLEDLSDFIEKNGRAKEWLRARCLETAIASAGLDEYLSTILNFRGISPSKTSPINLMFASSQISRALDPIVVKLLEDYSKRNIHIPKEKWDALLTILKPRLDFTVDIRDVYFDVDELGYLRNLLLSAALDKIVNVSDNCITDKNTHENGPILEFLEEVPGVTFEKLLEASKEYFGLKITIDRGILKWKYSQQPTIYIFENRAFFDLREMKNTNASFDVVKRQIYLMKRAVFSGELKNKRHKETKKLDSLKKEPETRQVIADKKIN